MPSPTPVYIEGYEKVLAAYGFWPSFHDAPARLTQEGDDRFTLELRPFKPYIHGNEAEDRKHPYNRYRVVFCFTGILRNAAQAFGTNNIIFELGFSTSEYVSENGSFIVDLDSAMGCDMCGHLRAKNGEVVVVEEISNSSAE